MSLLVRAFPVICERKDVEQFAGEVFDFQG